MIINIKNLILKRSLSIIHAIGHIYNYNPLGDVILDNPCRHSILSEDYGDYILNYDNDFRELASSNDFCYDVIDNTYAIVHIPLDMIDPNFLQIYGYRILPSCFGLMDVSSLVSSGVTSVRNQPNLDLNGEGVLIGIIDTGIEYTHEAFRNQDNLSKILTIWDQTIQEGEPPAGYAYGTEYTKEQIDEALLSDDPLSIVPSTDEIGHGTHIAGIAAGTPNPREQFSGVVPLAEFVVVKLKPAKQFVREFFFIPEDAICYQETDIMLGIRYLLSTAARFGRPISICIGFGTSQGGHDSRGALSSYLNNIADYRAVAVSIAAGNEGISGHHYSSTLTREISYETVELRVGANEPGFSMEFWGNSPSSFSIDILSPTGEYVPRIPARLGESRVIPFVFEQTIVYVDYQIIEAQTGDQMILVRFQTPTEGIWRFRVYASGDLSLHYHIWLPITPFLSSNTAFIRPNPETTVTSPGNTPIPIVATAYNHLNQTLYTYASRGFNRVGEITPDFAAPGVNLTAPALNNQYMDVSGTSAAAAHTCGVAAMLLEWGIVRENYTQMDSIEIRNLLIRGADREENTTYPNPEWGYGILNIYTTFSRLRGNP